MAEGVDYQDDGRIALDMCGQRYVIDRPTIGHMKRFMTMAADADREVNEAESRGERVFDEDGPYIEWLRGVVRELSHGAELPESDKMPSWAAGVPLVRGFVAHWRTVPLVRGTTGL